MAYTNIELDAMSGGQSVAVDRIASSDYQRIKMTWGVEGTATEIDATNRLPVVETNSAGILADTGSMDTSLTTLAGAIAGTEMQVDVVTSALPSGASTEATLSTLNGKITACNTGAVVVSSGAITETNSGAILADTASMDTNLATLAGTVTASEVAVSTAAPATGNAELCKAEDAASATGDVGIASLAVRDDALAADAGTSTDGDFTYLRVDNNGALWVNQSGGTGLFKSIDLDESEEEVKASAGKIYWIHATNLSASLRYLKVYNNTAAGVTVGTTVPDLTFPLPTQGDTNGISFDLEIPNGITMDTGITVAATTGIADNDSGAPGANEVVVNIGYS